MIKLIKNIDFKHIELNFEYENQLATIKVEPYLPFGCAIEKALNKFIEIPKNVHSYYLGKDLSNKLYTKIGDIFVNKEKVTIKLAIPDKKNIDNIKFSPIKKIKNNYSFNSNESTIKLSKGNNISENQTNIFTNSKFVFKDLKKSYNNKILSDSKKNNNKYNKLKIINCKRNLKNLFPSRNLMTINKRSSSLPTIFNSNNSNKKENLNINQNIKNNNKLFPFCDCKQNTILYYCRNCRKFICMKCREKHKEHLTIYLNSKNMEESVRVYLMIVLTDLEKKKVTDEKTEIISDEYFSDRKEDILEEYDELINLYIDLMKAINKKVKNEDENKIKSLIGGYKKAALQISKSIYEINNKIQKDFIKAKKKMEFEDLEFYFDELSHKEDILSLVSGGITQYHISTELNNKLLGALDDIENTLDEINDVFNPFNLTPEFNNELIKMNLAKNEIDDDY